MEKFFFANITFRIFSVIKKQINSLNNFFKDGVVGVKCHCLKQLTSYEKY